MDNTLYTIQHVHTGITWSGDYNDLITKACVIGVEKGRTEFKIVECKQKD